MKRFLALIVSIGILLSLTGCVILEEREDSTQQKEQLQKPQKQPPKDTIPQETEPEETQPEETEYPVPPELRPEETEPFTPYPETVKWADQPIYSGPSYAYNFVQTVGKAGTYTIVEEAYDVQGNLWGKLKSGIGWIDLTNSRYADGHRGEDEQILTAGFVDSRDQGDIFFLHDSSDYSVRIGITAHQALSFQLHSTEFSDAGYAFGSALSVGTLLPGERFVAQVAFPGDLSAYGLTVTDQKNNVSRYLLYTSGMDGSLVCQLYEPQAQYTYFLGSFCYHIPVVELPGVNAQRINALLYETHYQNLKENALDIPEQPFMLGMVYSVGQKGDIVSVMVQESCDCDLTYYSVYNFSASTGEEIKDADVFAAFGLTGNQGWENIKYSLSKYWDKMIGQMGAEGLEGYKNDTLGNGNIALFRPFIDENGALHYTGTIYSPAGAESYQWILDDHGNAWRETCQEHQ